MEDKQLDFNQPLLSVRRYTPTPTPQRNDERKINNPRPNIPRLPHYRSELKSGPVSNPGAVPFLWEQTPGKPKEDGKPQNQSFDKPPIAPKLPPGRHPKPGQQDVKNQSVNSPPNSSDNRRAVDLLPREISHIDSSSYDQNVEKLEISKEAAEEEEKASSDSSDDVAYVDALDTLSRTESFFLNCSMSELDGLDSIKQNQRFSTDPQAREFMMDRFLPAAKAMASETPQYAPKKQPLVQEQPQQLKKSVNQNHNNKPSLRYGPSFAKKYSHYHGNDEEEEESDDEYDRHEKFPAVCGLLPRFCLKSSFGILNPVPAMSVRTRAKLSSASKVQPKSLSSGSYSETENESRSDRTELKMIDNTKRDELDEDKTKLGDECGQLESLSTITHCDASEEIEVPEEKDCGGINSFGSHGKGFKTFQELLADQGSPEESNKGDPVIEKTLYVDKVQKAEYPNLMSLSPNSQENKSVPREDDRFISDKRMDDQMDAIDSSSVEDFKKSYAIDGEEKVANAPVFGDFTILSSIDKSAKECEMKKPISFQNYSQLPGPPPLPKSPSDSWLCRTLPSMPAKNSSSRAYFGAATNPQNQGFKAPKSDVKWETIVKTTNVQRRNLHYSEKLLTAIPET